MASNYDLKPCPFCGGNAYLRMAAIRRSYIIECGEGCIRMPADPNETFTSKEKAIEAWNKRVK